MKLCQIACCVLLLTSFSQVLSAPVGADIPASCCFSYTSRRIPQSHVKAYFSTNSLCSQAAIIFVTRKGREVCANPEETWVQSYINGLKPK
ncbi:C-C motif chemokine 4-like [Microcaecilia unicolor]|uniref:C-C motif chemokine n=1 Tax=Microcaecilia unicolor TaxID=1415580 RepID=A0A6P7WEN6_9AMPH|nr:C-C motif chemokine 4-like [Microcaecilia unicolor]